MLITHCINNSSSPVMSSENFLDGQLPRCTAIQSEALPPARSFSYSSRQDLGQTNIFEELPKATIVHVSRPDAGDISPMLLSYTIEFQYKQFKWRLLKRASQVIYLHFSLKKREIVEEFYEKQEQVKEWLQSLGVGDQTAVVEDEPDDETFPSAYDESAKNRRYIPPSAALPIIRPALGRQQAIADRAKIAMQAYINHFLGNLHIANSREVCKFLEVSKLSFSQEYGPKLKEDFVMVEHLSNIQRDTADRNCLPCFWFGCCDEKWQKVWAVLKPGFLALLEDPFGTKLLDIIIFNVLPISNKDGEGCAFIANELKDHNPLRYAFSVSCGSRTIKLRTTSSSRVREWVAAINDAGQRHPEGWCHPHRFGSFAPPRGLTEDGSQAQWFVDGQAAFEAIASSIEDAQSEIFMTGWWVCPELYLRRPFSNHASSRLDALLEAKAKKGVQIYILLYKEVSIALKINSAYSKKRLLLIHENVKVLRYPDHIATGIYLWSHHEKLVIVDHRICFIGGLDLCFGRYDTNEHKVGDCPSLLWPGKDYYNPRESEPSSWEDTMRDELERQKYPRMPWHDVHCALWGPPCYDVARHFVQRWNYAKRNKAPKETRIPLLMPQNYMVIPRYMRRSPEIGIDREKVTINSNNFIRQDYFFSQSPSQDIPLLVPQEALLNASNDDKKLNGLDMSYNFLNKPNGVFRSLSSSLRKTKVEPLAPDMQMKGFVDDMDLQNEMDVDVPKTDKWWETQEQGYQFVPGDEIGQVGPRISCHCQVVRSVSQWSAGTSGTEESIHSAYCSLIDRAEHFIYIENQFFLSGLSGDEFIQNRVSEALYRRIIRAHKEQRCFRVIIVLPLIPGFQGGLDDGGAATVRAIMHWQYRTICRGKNSILHNLRDLLGPKTDDYISFYGLRSYGRLFDGGPVATSQVYVHSKLMIIDDRAAVIGSSNINDRSLLGSRDSEIGVLIEDRECLQSSMNGLPWLAGKFTLSLRLSLWAEHLGLHAEKVNQIADPIADTTYKDQWLETAKKNTAIYQDVFGCIPNDLLCTRAALRQSMSYWKEKLGGQVSIDLGIAPQKLESYQNGETKFIDPMEKLKCVRGHLVSFPLEFMREEDLRPVFNEGEFYASPQVFH